MKKQQLNSGIYTSSYLLDDRYLVVVDAVNSQDECSYIHSVYDLKAMGQEGKTKQVSKKVKNNALS